MLSLLLPSGYLALLVGFVSGKGIALTGWRFLKNKTEGYQGKRLDSPFVVRGGTGGTHNVDGRSSEEPGLAAATRNEPAVAILSIGVRTLDTLVSASTALAAKRHQLLRGNHFYRPFVTPLGRRRNTSGVIRRFPIQSREYLSSVKTNKKERGKGKVCAASEDGQKLRSSTNKQEKQQKLLQEVSC